MTSNPLDHVGIAVPSIADARALYELLGGVPGTPAAEMPELGVNVAFIGPVELLEPRGPDSHVARFLEQRGPGIHHLAYRVADLDAELLRLEGQGYARLDPEPRRGLRGHRLAFLHPRGTGGVIIELVEDAGHAG